MHATAFVADTADVIGDVEIGEHSSVWFQSVNRGDVNDIREESIVAAGTLVTPGTHSPRRTLMMGSPVRPRRALTDADLELIHELARNDVLLEDLYSRGPVSRPAPMPVAPGRPAP